jgi:hypothetical protein
VQSIFFFYYLALLSINIQSNRQMERCAMVLRIETQEYIRALPSPSSSAASLNEAQCTGTHNAQAQELYGAMVQLANHLEQVTHDLLHHHHERHRHLAKATTSAASLAPTKKKTIEKKKKKASSARRRCEHCGQTSSAAWRRGPDYCLYVHTTFISSSSSSF